MTNSSLKTVLLAAAAVAAFVFVFSIIFLPPAADVVALLR
jgi:hypothetical protein